MVNVENFPNIHKGKFLNVQKLTKTVIFQSVLSVIVKKVAVAILMLYLTYSSKNKPLYKIYMEFLLHDNSFSQVSVTSEVSRN